ncbi:FlhB1 [Desulforapulum autotrophicum HRM2]|uniref:FlhB1 n=1 Tax=Desulforapulum autotrophicum (strain ATCC 43914 / DSM 3382 / VKM B-1955 / HRM2) TaxID=177437 RepID=C0QA44_DESAH|nr:EscU/YscU/HrcU family type III secretion system export apparatus switch protein [Desulforapulum autotrophicum]ACN16762.1 FlhB1 [Desulforapulum autotrophicum HRM2]
MGKKKAVALKYDRAAGSSPKVTAKGSGIVAQKIIDIAEQHDVPVKKDPDLVEVLAGLDINQEIPQEIYVAVAELLAFVYSINKNRPKP